MFWADLDDEQRLKLGRIQAFMAAAEGYGDHVMQALGAELLGSFARIEEAMKRYREGEHGDPVFERLLGVDMKREQYAKGRAFCEVVVEQSDEATLARMWESAEAMPSLPELDEPRLWLARTVERRGPRARRLVIARDVGRRAGRGGRRRRAGLERLGDGAGRHLPRRPTRSRPPLRAVPRLEGTDWLRTEQVRSFGASGRTPTAGARRHAGWRGCWT